MRLTWVWMLTGVALAIASVAFAEIQSKEIEYPQGDSLLQGFMVWPEQTKGKVPGVLVVHEWWGHNEHARFQARRLAQAGYVALALDMYGKGKLATHPADAEAFMKEATKDPAVVAARFNAALDILRKDPRVDGQRIAAIGYCFGGGVVLDMARSGADLRAVATFHGMLATNTPAQPRKIKAQVLVLNGADDPMNPPEVVERFKKEMAAAKARYEVISYPGAKHAFTNPKADTYGMAALSYNAKVDHQSWAEMLKMFKTALK